MKKIIFISFMFSLVFLASAENLLACSCVANLKPLKQQVTDAFRGSTAVFSGQVLSVTPKDEFSLTVKIKVEKLWKGKFSKEIIVTTGKDSAMCGYWFEVGKKYLLYTNGTKGELSAGLCSRTAPAAANKDFKYLDKLKKPIKVKAA